MKLQKDENGRVFFIDNTLVPCWEQIIERLNTGKDYRITYLDGILIPCDAKSEEAIYFNQYGGWKRQYSDEEIERMYQDSQTKQEVADYGVTTG